MSVGLENLTLYCVSPFSRVTSTAFCPAGASDSLITCTRSLYDSFSSGRFDMKITPTSVTTQRMIRMKTMLLFTGDGLRSAGLRSGSLSFFIGDSRKWRQ